MREYSYISKPENKVAARLSVLFFGAGALLLATVSVFTVPFLGAFQFLAALFFTLAVLILTRYVFKSYLIKISESSPGHFDLTVTECKGKENKTQTTVCRVSIDNLEKAVLKTCENKDELSLLEKGRKVFSYCPDLSPERECYLFVTECGEPLLLKISPDDTLLSILLEAQKGILNEEDDI